MLPGVDGFRWSAGNLVFLGVFYSVVTVITATVLLTLMRAVKDFRSRRVEEIRWKAEFEDLTARARACRHALTREAGERTCENAFECRSCSVHPRFLGSRDADQPAARKAAGGILGLEIPLDRMYHRGHAGSKRNRMARCWWAWMTSPPG